MSEILTVLSRIDNFLTKGSHIEKFRYGTRLNLCPLSEILTTSVERVEPCETERGGVLNGKAYTHLGLWEPSRYFAAKVPQLLQVSRLSLRLLFGIT